MGMNANDWIKDRRSIHGAATEGPWEWEGESNDAWPQSDNSLMAGGEAAVIGWGYDASGIMVDDEDATAIADALNNLPALLSAIEAVLELHTRIVTDRHVTGPTAVCEQCSEDRMFALWPCETVEAIERAING